MTDEEIQRLQAEHWAKPASQYSQGGRYHELPAPAAPDQATAHEMILEAFKYPVTLPAGAFPKKKMTVPHNRRGRPRTASMYDDFIHCLKGEMHRQARLPRLRIGTKNRNSFSTQVTPEIVRRIAEAQSSGKKPMAAKIHRQLEIDKLHGRYRGIIPSAATVGRIVAKLRRSGISPK